MSYETALLDKQIGDTINAKRALLAEAVTARHFELHPELESRYGAVGREKCLQDAHYHLSYLAEAINTSLPSLFADYVAWAKVMLESRGVPASDLARNLEIIRIVVREHLPTEMSDQAGRFISEGVRRLPQIDSLLPTHICKGGAHAELARQYLEALLRGERHRASDLILAAVGGGITVREAYMHVFQPAQREIGRLWQLNLLSVAQEHYCTAATQLIMSQLYPHIFSAERNGRTLVATCV
ncbi:MAG: B12-binding domain-containing protein, partial [Pyrinomonadaceae bacterium]|nr:B12-binding domain-containing protein [Pyrinomonadaceae bacterium]